MKKIDAATFSRLMADKGSATTYAMISAYIKAALAGVDVDTPMSTHDLYFAIIDEVPMSEATRFERDALNRIVENLAKKDLAAWNYRGAPRQIRHNNPRLIRPKRWFDGSKYDKPKPTHCPTCKQILPDAI